MSHSALPILHDEGLEYPITSGVGEYADPCSKCALKAVCVGGCCNTNNHATCEQRTCHRECNDCGGGPALRYTGANVPAVCSKAPLKDLQLNQVHQDRYHFKKRRLIELESKAIVVTQGSHGRSGPSFYPDDMEAIGVNIRHVWSGRGWFSHDMRDYLRVPDGAKLILLTSTHDDILERAWEQEVHHDDLKALGFDFWQALTFSQYATMSRFNNLWAGYRTLRAIETSSAHFCTRPPFGIDLSKPGALAAWESCAKAIPQIMVNWQYTKLQNLDDFRWMVAILKRSLAIMPAKAIWFTGVVGYDQIFNLKLNFPEHDCYFLSVNPWLAAFKGDEFSPVGKLKKSKLPRRELVLRNQRNYANLVERALRAAASELRKSS